MSEPKGEEEVTEYQIRADWNHRAENVDGDEQVADFLA